MEFFRIRRDIPFMKHALVFNVISLVTFVLAVLFLVMRGLNFSIEFTGGVVIETHYAQAANLEGIRGALEKAGLHEPQVQNFGTSQDVMIRLAAKDGANPLLSSPEEKTGKLTLDGAKVKTNILTQGGAGAERAHGGNPRPRNPRRPVRCSALWGVGCGAWLGCGGTPGGARCLLPASPHDPLRGRAGCRR